MKSAPRAGIVAAMHPELAAVLAAMPDERRQRVAQHIERARIRRMQAQAASD